MVYCSVNVINLNTIKKFSVSKDPGNCSSNGSSYTVKNLPCSVTRSAMQKVMLNASSTSIAQNYVGQLKKKRRVFCMRTSLKASDCNPRSLNSEQRFAQERPEQFDKDDNLSGKVYLQQVPEMAYKQHHDEERQIYPNTLIWYN